MINRSKPRELCYHAFPIITSMEMAETYRKLMMCFVVYNVSRKRACVWFCFF